MGYLSIKVDDLKSGEDLAGFTGEAEIGGTYRDHEDFTLTDVAVQVWRDGRLAWISAPPQVANAIRAELYSDDYWLRRIAEDIASDLAERDDAHAKRIRRGGL